MCSYVYKLVCIDTTIKLMGPKREFIFIKRKHQSLYNNKHANVDFVNNNYQHRDYNLINHPLPFLHSKNSGNDNEMLC